MLTREMFKIATRIDDAYVINIGSSKDYRDTAFTLFEICDADIDKYETLLDKATDYAIEEEYIIDFFNCDGDIDAYDKMHPLD